MGLWDEGFQSARFPKKDLTVYRLSPFVYMNIIQCKAIDGICPLISNTLYDY